MRHLDLFSGIGGFALAARWMNWQTIGFVEIDKFCQKVLAKNFPNIPIYGDIKEFDGTKLRGTVDILTGGFPCQPYSTSGKRKGTEDPRHLWPEMLRVIGEVQPSFIVGENVSGLVNWSRGLVFDQIQIDLENQGYEVTPYLLPACGTGAWHTRERVWFIAHTYSNGRKYGKLSRQEGCERSTLSQANSHYTNDNGQRFKGGNERMQASQRYGHDKARVTSGELRECWDRDGLPSPTICRVDDGLPNRVDRVKGLGNAVVPQIVFEIYKAIELTKASYQPGGR